jgi:hypothetical protein
MLHDLVRKLSGAYLQKAGVTDKADCTMKARAASGSRVGIGGVFNVVCRDKDGNLKWQEETHNIWVNSGLADLINVYFHASTQCTTWYVGLYSDTSPSATWTGTGDTTEFTSYSGTRPAYVESAASGTTTASIDNSSSKASFSITGSGTIYGAFLCKLTSSAAAICCAANFTTQRAVASGDTVEVTYTVQATDDGA